MKFLKNELHQLPRIVRGLAQQPYHFVLFCDDLSFESGDTGYQALKSVLEGSLAQMPENLMVIATSNRRHLVPEHGSDNAGSRWEDSELHMSDAVEEKLLWPIGLVWRSVFINIQPRITSPFAKLHITRLRSKSDSLCQRSMIVCQLRRSGLRPSAGAVADESLINSPEIGSAAI